MKNSCQFLLLLVCLLTSEAGASEDGILDVEAPGYVRYNQKTTISFTVRPPCDSGLEIRRLHPSSNRPDECIIGNNWKCQHWDREDSVSITSNATASTLTIENVNGYALNGHYSALCANPAKEYQGSRPLVIGVSPEILQVELFLAPSYESNRHILVRRHRQAGTDSFTASSSVKVDSCNGTPLWLSLQLGNGFFPPTFHGHPRYSNFRQSLLLNFLNLPVSARYSEIELPSIGYPLGQRYFYSIPFNCNLEALARNPQQLYFDSAMQAIDNNTGLNQKMDTAMFNFTVTIAPEALVSNGHRKNRQLNISEAKVFFAWPGDFQVQYGDVELLEPQRNHSPLLKTVYTNRNRITRVGKYTKSILIVTIGVRIPSTGNNELDLQTTDTRLLNAQPDGFLDFISNQPFYQTNGSLSGFRSIFQGSTSSILEIVGDCQCSFQGNFMAQLSSPDFRSESISVRLNFDYLAVKKMAAHILQAGDLWAFPPDAGAQVDDFLLTCSVCACSKSDVRLEYKWSFFGVPGHDELRNIPGNLTLWPNLFLLKKHLITGDIRVGCRVIGYDLITGNEVMETDETEWLSGIFRGYSGESIHVVWASLGTSSGHYSNSCWQGTRSLINFWYSDAEIIMPSVTTTGCLYSSTAGCHEDSGTCEPSDCSYDRRKCDQDCLNPYCRMIHCDQSWF